jgi:hypothetical protein
MAYKETCNLCKGNGYITVVVKEKEEIKQCWLCESEGEKKMNKDNWRLAPWQDYPEDDDVNPDWDADWDDVIDPSDPLEERE